MRVKGARQGLLSSTRLYTTLEDLEEESTDDSGGEEMEAIVPRRTASGRMNDVQTEEAQKLALKTKKRPHAADAAATQRERVALFMRGGTKQGLLYNQVQIVVSVAACVLYIAETYYTDEKELAYSAIALEVIFSLVFLVDWVLQIYAAEYKIRYLLSFNSFVDLLSVFPIFIVFFNMPASLGFVRFLRVFRIVRVLRLHQLAAFHANALRHQVLSLFITTLSLLFCATGVMHAISVLEPGSFVELSKDSGSTTGSPMSFFTCLYFVVVSVLTVGYGDVVPVSQFSRMATAVTLVMSFMLLPRQVNSLFRVMESRSKYGGSLELAKDEKHVIVACSRLTVDNCRYFLREFFHPDHASRTLNTKVLFLSADEPTPAMLALINETSYFQRVLFLKGSLMEDRDLARVGLKRCRGLFVLTDKMSAHTMLDDQKIVLKVLAVVKYMQRKHQRILTSVQLHHADHVQRLYETGVDNVMSVERMGGTLLAQSCRCLGYSTMICNLIAGHSPKFEPQDVLATGLTDWFDEYYYGMSHEIYLVTIPLCVVGKPFLEAVHTIYRCFGAVLFGVETANPAAGGGFEILLNPGNNYIMSRGDRGIVMAMSSVHAEKIMTMTASTPRLHGLDLDLTISRRQSEIELSVQQTSIHIPGVNEESNGGNTIRAPGWSRDVSSQPLSTSDPFDQSPFAERAAASRPLSTARKSLNTTMNEQKMHAVIDEVKEESDAANTEVEGVKSEDGFEENAPKKHASRQGTSGAREGAREKARTHGVVVRRVRELLAEVMLNLGTENAQNLEEGASPYPDSTEGIYPRGNPDQWQASLEEADRLLAGLEADTDRALAPLSQQQMAKSPRRAGTRRSAPDAAIRTLSHQGLDRRHPSSPSAFASPQLRPSFMGSSHDTLPDLEILPAEGHVVLVGDVFIVEHLILPLRAPHVAKYLPLVVMHPNPEIVLHLSERLSQFDHVYVVVGSPTNRKDLQRINIAKCSAIIIATNPLSEDRGDSGLVDSEALLSNIEITGALAEAGNSNARVIVSLIHDSNLKFFDEVSRVPESVMAKELRSSEVVFSPAFAAGKVFMASHLDTLITQSFFNHSIIRIVLALSGYTSTTEKNSLYKSHLYQIDVPFDFIGQTYSSLFFALGQQGHLSLGIYRAAGHLNSPLPFVSTNPPPNARLRAGDRVFVLSPDASERLSPNA